VTDLVRLMTGEMVSYGGKKYGRKGLDLQMEVCTVLVSITFFILPPQSPIVTSL
jgi:hypothetical protein